MTPPGVLRHLRPPRREVSTPRVTEALAEFVIHNSRKEAAACMGITLGTIREHLRHAHIATNTESTLETLTALGWVRIPSGVSKHNVEALRWQLR
jgi:DNA-binding CsgD family transcriptional regulator